MSEEITINDYQFLVPVSINVTIDGQEVFVLGQLDYANRELYLPDEYKNRGMEDKFFEYLREFNSLPSNFYAVQRPKVPQAQDFTGEQS